MRFTEQISYCCELKRTEMMKTQMAERKVLNRTKTLENISL